MLFDIERMNEQELDNFILHAEVQKQEIVKEKIISLREAALRIVQAEGLKIEQVLAIGTEKLRRAKAKPKYRNPADHSQTWAGRGRTPRWFAQSIDAGASEQDLRVG